MEKFLIGKIVKAQGIKGEVKIKSRCGDLAFLGKQKYLMIKGQNVAVKSMRTGGEFAYVLFSTIADRNMAEALIGQDVYADRRNITLDDDSYFTSDMMGSRVVLDDGSEYASLYIDYTDEQALRITQYVNGEEQEYVLSSTPEHVVANVSQLPDLFLANTR